MDSGQKREASEKNACRTWELDRVIRQTPNGGRSRGEWVGVRGDAALLRVNAVGAYRELGLFPARTAVHSPAIPAAFTIANDGRIPVDRLTDILKEAGIPLSPAQRR